MTRSKFFFLAVTTALAVVLIAPSALSAWAPAKTATIHPGVQVLTAGAQCTSNFVFQEGTSVYLGQAAHCSGTGGQTETDGCTSGSLPLGTPVEVKGASKPGTLVYNFLNENGEAFGVLSTLQIAPLAGTNGVGDLGKELAYLRAHSSFSGMQLVHGTGAFKPNLVEAILGV